MTVAITLQEPVLSSVRCTWTICRAAKATLELFPAISPGSPAGWKVLRTARKDSSKAEMSFAALSWASVSFCSMAR